MERHFFVTQGTNAKESATSYIFSLLDVRKMYKENSKLEIQIPRILLAASGRELKGSTEQSARLPTKLSL